MAVWTNRSSAGHCVWTWVGFSLHATVVVPEVGKLVTSIRTRVPRLLRKPDLLRAVPGCLAGQPAQRWNLVSSPVVADRPTGVNTAHCQ